MSVYVWGQQRLVTACSDSRIPITFFWGNWWDFEGIVVRMMKWWNGGMIEWFECAQHKQTKGTPDESADDDDKLRVETQDIGSYKINEINKIKRHSGPVQRDIRREQREIIISTPSHADGVRQGLFKVWLMMNWLMNGVWVGGFFFSDHQYFETA